MLRILLMILFCATGTAAMARNISLDLSGSGGARMRAAYSQSAVADNEEIRSHRLEAGAAKVSGLEVGDVIAFKLFDDKTLEVTLVKETEALSGRAFLGRIDNALNALGCVVLETEAGIILDVTDFENQRVWKVVSDENGVMVREIKPDNTRRQGGDTLYRPVGQAPMNVSITTTNGVSTVVTNFVTEAVQSTSLSCDGMPRPMPVISMSKTLDAVSSGETTVDILINYDTDAASWARSNGGGLQSFAETCVQKMNTALANTGLDDYFTFRLVGVYEVGGSALGDIKNAVYYATGYYSGTFNGVSWAGVGTERDRVGADIVCTLCDNGSTFGTVGIGWALMSHSDCASCGFNACQIRSVANSHTMTHEVGHNMGAGHGDKQIDDPGPQYYTYSSGYYFTAGGTKYNTIMAYDSDGYGNYYTEAPYFSSPNHTYRGVAVGTAAKNDNTRTLRENWQMVAANRVATGGDDEYDDDPPVAWIDLPTALDSTTLEFSTDGSKPWYGQTEYSYDGVDAARSGDITSNQESWMQATVSGAGTVSFRWMVSSESNYDFLEFLIDGVSKEKISGTGSSWTSKSFMVSTTGSHTLKWRYVKDGSLDRGDDAGFVDSVVWAPSRTYTVKFNRMDYSGTTYTYALPVGVSSQLPTLQDMGWSYSGHYFMGWSTRVYNPALEPAGVVDFIDGASVKDLASAGQTITLYAVWSASPLKSMPSLSSSASASTVNATVDGVGFADADVKKVIGGSASVYSAFRTWARSMTGGEAAVALSPHAAAAYLLGATQLFGYAPTITLGAPSAGSGGGSAFTVEVAVKDGERPMDVDAAKIVAMFEATSSLNDWSGNSKQALTVTVEEDTNSAMRFRVSPRSGSARQMFIRIRKQL